uniref:Pco089553b n=1 Tax=Arundo donax TaxID=35708 RepID=A0A0A9B095_ARUDO
MLRASMRMLGTISTISSSATNSTLEGEKMERCGSDCPAMATRWMAEIPNPRQPEHTKAS